MYGFPTTLTGIGICRALTNAAEQFLRSACARLSDNGAPVLAA
jgi:hypothetical protein